MIIFKGTKKIGTQSYIEFSNNLNSSIQIPLDDKIISMILLYFDRLSPGIKEAIENQDS